MQKLIRTFKDRVTYHYYHFRLDRSPSPYHLLFRTQPYKILWILSHMRSGSSLLTHILATHPDIIGYGETHLKYTTEADFRTLLHKVYWTVRGLSMNHTYVLDKLLHDSKLEEPILSSSSLYGIFLLREPRGAIASLLKLKSHWNEEKAVNYYCDRLASLERYARKMGDRDRGLFFTYQDLLEKSDRVFGTLQDFLQVDTAFSETYDLLPLTGFKGVGDSSENIKAGRILKEKISQDKISQEKKEADFTLAEPFLHQSLEAFEKARTSLSQNCKTID